jgi:dienelactone hydrolase
MGGIVLSFPVSRALAQEVPETVKRPIGEEAYEILKLFYDYDRDASLEARIVDKQDRPNCTREKIVFRVRDSWVVGYLGIPKSGTPPYPCVLELHGVGGSKEYWWEEDSASSGGSMTRALLSAGIAVFTPDAQYHGERIFSNGFESPAELVINQRVERLRDMSVQSVVDCRRAIDYLETRSEIDKSRIGVTGHSLGGIESFALTALDSRIKVAVACITPVGNLDRMGDPVRAPRNFARALGGRPFLMQMGRNDPFCTPEQAQNLYEIIPGSKKELVFYDSGHSLPTEYVPKALKWLQDGLK